MWHFNFRTIQLLKLAIDSYKTELAVFFCKYRMMGFDEDRGIIPRLCEDLFTQIAQMDKQQVICLCY